MALHAEQVRQREGDLAARVGGVLRGGPVRVLRLGPVEQVALQERHLGAADQLGVHVAGAEERRGAQVGVHGAVGVGRDHDQAAPGGRAIADRRVGEVDALGLHVVGEHRAELVVEDAAQVGGAAPEAGHPGHRVAGRAARHLDGHAHGRVELLGPLGVDQGHGALHEAVGGDELVGLVGDDVDEGVADPDDVEAGLGGHPGEASNPAIRGNAVGAVLATVAPRVREPPPASPHRRPQPLRPHAGARPRCGHVRRRGDDHRRGGDAHGRGRAQLGRDRDRRGHHPGRRGRAPGRHRGARPGERAGHAHLPVRAARGAGLAPPALPRHPQRQAGRLLPLDVHRRQRRRAGPGHHPDGGHRRPPGLPVLGRARRQGRLRRHPGGPRATWRPSPTRARSAGSPRARARWPCASPTPCPCPPTWWRSWWAPWRSPTRWTWTASRCGWCTRRARSTSPTSPWRWAPSPCATSPTGSAWPTRATSSTWWPSPTSPSGPWRTWAASPSASATS